MKYSKWIGMVAAVIIIIACYTTWVYVPSVSMAIGGMHSSLKNNFGKPGLMNIILSVIAILFFLLPFIWAKRTNIFICALNIAWAIRNYILLTKCYSGECPEKRSGLYLLLIASAIMMIMSFIPKVEIGQEGNGNS